MSLSISFLADRLLSIRRASNIHTLLCFITMMVGVVAVGETHSQQALAATAPVVSVTIAGSSSIEGRVGDEPVEESYSLSVTGGLTKGQECTVWQDGTYPGPWSDAGYYWYPGTDNSGGIRTTMDGYNSTTATLKVEFLYPGDYTIQLYGGAYYNSSCGSAGGSDTKTINVHVRGREWEPDTGIEIDGGINSNVAESPSPQSLPMRFVQPGQRVYLSMGDAHDSDHWTMGDEEGDEDDQLTYEWEVTSFGEAGALSNPTGQYTQWVVPPVVGDNDGMMVTIDCTVDDRAEIGFYEDGDRDDDEEVETLTFMVVRRKWAASPSIGQHPQRDASGQFDPNNVTWVNDGEITSPAPGNAPHKVLEGERVYLQVSEAQDWDNWTHQALGSGFSQDGPLSYTWSAGKGHFEVWDAQGNMTEESSATGRSVTWIAPDDIDSDTDVAIKCTIDDPAGARLGDNEGGTHDDGSLERTVNVKVLLAEASVKLAFYKQVVDSTTGAVSYEQASGTLGGTVYGAVEVRTRNGARAQSSNAQLRFEETEKVEGEAHPTHENHFDVTVPMGQWSGWQKKDSAGEWVDSSESPMSGSSEGGEYRYLVAWNTASQRSSWRWVGNGTEMDTLLGHNGSHELKLVTVDGAAGDPIKFVSYSGRPVSVEAPKKGEATVGNLVITEVSTSNGTQDYFKWDPSSGESSLAAPVVNFTVEDEDQDNPGAYRWTIYFAKTSDVHSTPNTDWTASARRVWGVSSTARSFSINLASLDVNGHLRMQPEDDPETEVNESAVPFDERSPYTFDIRVVKFPSTQEIPSDPSSESGEVGRSQFKQPYSLWIPYQFQTPATPTTPSQTQSGHDIWFNDQPDGTSEIRAKYYLYPNPAVEEERRGANSVKLTSMDPTFAERDSIDGPTNAGELHDDLLVGSILEDDVSGDWRVLFTAEDKAGAVQRRDHTNTRMIPVNQIKPFNRISLDTSADGDFYRDPLQSGTALGSDISWGSSGSSGDLHYREANKPETAYFAVKLRGEMRVPSSAVRSLPATIQLSAQRITKSPSTGGMMRGGTATPLTIRKTTNQTPVAAPGGQTQVIVRFEMRAADEWDVTQKRGRWDVTSTNVKRSKGLTLKIDKREQIVQIAKEWSGEPQGGGKHGGDRCDDIVRYVYRHVGFDDVSQIGTCSDLIADMADDPNAPANSQNTPFAFGKIWDTKKGSIAFYHFYKTSYTSTRDDGSWQHNGIHLGGFDIVDQNCGLHQELVGSHSAYHLELLSPAVPGRTTPGSGRYDLPSFFSPKTLQELDAQ